MRATAYSSTAISRREVGNKVAELAIEPIVATRLFRLDPNKLVLMSIAKDDVWEPCEIKQSICYHAKAHGYTKPEFRCTCGIWSCKTRAALKRTFPFLGSFNIWLRLQPTYLH